MVVRYMGFRCAEIKQILVVTVNCFPCFYSASE